MKGITISTDGIIKVVDVKSNGEPLYEQMHKAVGGYYENVHPRTLPRGCVMVVNEEGVIKGLPINPLASFLYESDKHGEPICGNVIILKLGYYEGEPDVIGIDDDEAYELMNRLSSLNEEVIRDAIRRTINAAFNAG